MTDVRSSPSVSNETGLAGLGAAAIAVAAWGTSGVIVKAVDLDPVAISFYRFSIYTLSVLVVLRIRRSRPGLTVLRHTAAGGICLGLDVVLFFTAVKSTTVVNATTIGALQPIIVLGIASRFFGERVRAREVIAAMTAIVGVVVVVTQSSGSPEWNGAGDLAALGALFAWTGYLVMAKRSAGVLTPTEYTLGTGFWTAMVALPVGFLFGQDMSIPRPNQWLVLIVLVIIGGVFGHSMMNWSLQRIPLWLGSTLTLLIPVVSSLTAWATLGEALSVPQLLAIAVVIGALAVIVLSQRTPTPTPPPTAPLTSVPDPSEPVERPEGQ
ncbi:MAG: EamA family transporter [Actinomycetota bacterium]|nr:EamA family transporter [Actinomycetota bacterium]MDA3015896.1 EamA family transporter [Actinomycetota bacterium]MDA3029162.1 EamA family transporter [Actinomycetota bacterium]